MSGLHTLSVLELHISKVSAFIVSLSGIRVTYFKCQFQTAMKDITRWICRSMIYHRLLTCEWRIKTRYHGNRTDAVWRRKLASMSRPLVYPNDTECKFNENHHRCTANVTECSKKSVFAKFA